MKISNNYFDPIHIPTPQRLQDPLLSLYPHIHVFSFSNSSNSICAELYKI